MAVEATEQQIVDEMVKLRGIYENIRKKARSYNAPALLYAKENKSFRLMSEALCRMSSIHPAVIK